MQVWLELDKDGQHVVDQIVLLAGDGTWTFKFPVLGLDDVPVLKVHINQVFQGQLRLLSRWMVYGLLTMQAR